METTIRFALAPGTKLNVSILGARDSAVPGFVVSAENAQIHARVAAALPPDTAIQVEAAGVVLLGEVVGCEENAEGYLLKVRPRHSLSLLPQLTDLNDTLIREAEPARRLVSADHWR